MLGRPHMCEEMLFRFLPGTHGREVAVLSRHVGLQESALAGLRHHIKSFSTPD